MSKLSPKLQEEDMLSSLEMSSVQAGTEVPACFCTCSSSKAYGAMYSRGYVKQRPSVVKPDKR